MTLTASIHMRALVDFPIVQPGGDIADMIIRHWRAAPPHDQDVVVVAQKIVSKSEGRLVHLHHVRPSDRATEIAAVTGKDPRLVEIILGESERVVRQRPGVLIVRHRLGPVLANAGVDQSNVPAWSGAALAAGSGRERGAAARPALRAFRRGNSRW